MMGYTPRASRPRIGRFSGRDNTVFSGRRTCQCPLCWEVFSGESAFIMHRANGNHRPSMRLGACVEPSNFGLTLNDSGVWFNASTAFPRTFEDHSKDD